MASDADLAVLCQARRILVLGSPGAGKTLLATSLCRHLGLPLVRLDDFFWKPGPVRLPTDEWRTRVAQLAARPSWVMDGTYEASLDLRIPSADAFVYIQSSRWICLWRVVIRRLLGRWRRHEQSSPGHTLTPFFVRYVFQFPVLTQPAVLKLIARDGPARPLIVLDGARGVNRLIHQLEQAPPVSPKGGIPADDRLAKLQRNHHA